MANTMPCGECKNYWEVRRPLKSGKGYVSLQRGHCLKKTIYAENKPGKPVYPPGANIQPTPDGRHKVVLVRAEQVVAGCPHAAK